MKNTFFLYAVASLFLACVAISGCSSQEPDSASAPSKEEIDKGLAGQPGIDPKDSAPMGSKGG